MYTNVHMNFRRHIYPTRVIQLISTAVINSFGEISPPSINRLKDSLLYFRVQFSAIVLTSRDVISAV